MTKEIIDSRGPWTRTSTGGRYYPLDPRPEDFCIEDIAHGLAMENRFGGHTFEPYSVAQHAVLVSYHVPKGQELSALHHDDSEAYHRDMPSPIKHLPEMEAFRSIEHRTMDAIRICFGLPMFESPEIKIADVRALITEMRDLQGYKSTRYNRRPFKEKIVPLSWKEAKALFLKRHYELTDEYRNRTTHNKGTEG
jgi:5'-deoxynucleotidase YfbR-like HD superfamily hydrolase